MRHVIAGSRAEQRVGDEATSPVSPPHAGTRRVSFSCLALRKTIVGAWALAALRVSASSGQPQNQPPFLAMTRLIQPAKFIRTPEPVTRGGRLNPEEPVALRFLPGVMARRCAPELPATFGPGRRPSGGAFNEVFSLRTAFFRAAGAGMASLRANGRTSGNDQTGSCGK